MLPNNQQKQNPLIFQGVDIKLINNNGYHTFGNLLFTTAIPAFCAWRCLISDSAVASCNNHNVISSKIFFFYPFFLYP